MEKVVPSPIKHSSTFFTTIFASLLLKDHLILAMFEDATTTETIFWYCAIIGSVFFLFKVALTLLAGADLDLDADADIDLDHDGVDAHDTEVAFKLLSVSGIASFIMMFGWAGLAAYNQYDLGATLSYIIATAVGTASMFMVAYIFKAALALKSDGAKFDKNEIVGLSGKVYQKIPKDGAGRIQITVGGFLRELDAVSESGSAIESFKEVEVINLINPHTVTVKILEQQEE